MALPITVPYVFGNVTSSIPLTNLDSDFATIYAAVNGIGNGTVALANVTITGGSIQNVSVTLDTINNTPIGNTTPSTGAFTSLTDTGLTSGRVTYAGASGLLQDSANMTFNGTTLTLANDASISGLTVGKGGGSGSTNTAFGSSAIGSSNSGGSNTGIGYLALTANTSGVQQTAVGAYAAYTTTSGTANSAFGYAALGLNTTGANNVTIGNTALYSNTTASNNTAVGYQAGYNNTVNGNNSYGGYQAGYNFIGSYNTAWGYQSLYGSGTVANNTGNNNTAIGNSALYANSSGTDNQAFGTTALYSNTTGGANTAVGRDSLRNNTTASYNTAVGYQAGYTNSTGTYNIFIGHQSGYTSSPSGSNGYNTIMGAYAGYYLTTGYSNTFIGTSQSTGFGAGAYVTTGSKNTIIGGYNGNQGGLDIRTASNYIVLSDGDGNPRGIFDNSGNFLVGQTAVGTSNTNSLSLQGPNNQGTVGINHANGTTSATSYAYFAYNASIIGSITQNGTTGVLYNLTSDYRLKDNPQPLTGASEFIMALQPKTWDWWDGSGKGVGFIAHEFMEVAKYSGNGTKDEVDAEGKPVFQSIQPSSSEVMANLVALVQELNAKVTALEAQLGAK